MDKYDYMKEAIRLADESAEEGEVPVGAVIVRDGAIIATGRNRRETGKNALYHAEIEAINNACKTLGGWRLPRCELYVTLEPCPMCAGAIINARIPELVFGAREENSGSCGSVIDLFAEKYGHAPKVYSGVCAEESRQLLREFFEGFR